MFSTTQHRAPDAGQPPHPMPNSLLGKRFLDTTRGQIVTLLRRQSHTVEELAGALQLTDNAVRNHLAILERDGIIRQRGVRRGQGAGKPATIFELHPDAESLFSRAYEPVLTATIEVLVDELPEAQAIEVLQKVGRRLARNAAAGADVSAEDRTDAAASVLRSLGGDVTITREGTDAVLRGAGCPLATSVACRPHACHIVAALVAEVAGVAVESCCDRSERPRCCFRMKPAA